MRADRAALLDLADRVEALTESDREVDAEVMEAFGHKITWLPGGDIRAANAGPVIHWQTPHPYAGMKETCPDLTASLDAAMALMGEVLPGWAVEITVWDCGGSGAMIWSTAESGEAVKASHPARALVAAVLRAVATMGDG